MFDDLIDASFTVLSSDKQEVELVPGGKQVRVTWDDKVGTNKIQNSTINF